MERVDLTNPGELREAVLTPSSYQEVWRKARERLGGHDWHELTFLHDALCFMQDYGGRIDRKELSLLGDYIQNGMEYIETCLISALEELDLVVLDGTTMQLTERSSALQYSPRFVLVPYVEDQ